MEFKTGDRFRAKLNNATFTLLKSRVVLGDEMEKEPPISAGWDVRFQVDGEKPQYFPIPEWQIRAQLDDGDTERLPD